MVTLLGVPDEIDTFFKSFDDALGRKQTRLRARQYALGLMLEIEHKDCQKLADHVPGTRRELFRNLLNTSHWDRQGVDNARVADILRCPEFAVPDLKTAIRRRAVLAIDDTSHARKGTCVDDVQRQYCGQLGKVDSCRVVVTCHVACGFEHVPLFHDSYTPEGQCTPKHPFRDKPTIALDQLRRLKKLNPTLVCALAVVSDAWYGSNANFREGLEDLGLSFAVAVQGNGHYFLAEPGRELPKSTQPLERFVTALKPEDFERVSYPVSTGYREVRYVHEVIARQKGRTRDCRLVFSTTDPNHPTTENTDFLVAKLPEDAKPGDVVALYGQRNWIEVFYKTAKTRFGLSQVQVYSRHGQERHFSLVFAAYTYAWRKGRSLQADQIEAAKKNGTRESDGYSEISDARSSEPPRSVAAAAGS